MRLSPNPWSRAQVELERLASVERKRVDPRKLASHKRTLASGPQDHKYIAYYVDEGTLQWVLREDIMAAEARLDGWYLLQTDLAQEQSAKEDILAHYKLPMEVESAFRELKGYLEVHPVYHYRPDRVRNHVAGIFARGAGGRASASICTDGAGASQW